MKPGSKHRITRIAFGGLFAFTMLLGGANLRAIAEEDDDKDTAFDVKIMRDALRALGLRRDEAGIDYRERSPLVIPPSRNLPPPETASKDLGPSWPNDPDVKRARDAKAAAKTSPGPIPIRLTPGGRCGRISTTTEQRRRSPKAGPTARIAPIRRNR